MNLVCSKNDDDFSFMIQVSFMFSGNRALIASAVFMRDLDLCSWTQSGNSLFDPARVLRWEFVHFRY